jgi:hypothetical protein
LFDGEEAETQIAGHATGVAHDDDKFEKNSSGSFKETVPTLPK